MLLGSIRCFRGGQGAFGVNKVLLGMVKVVWSLIRCFWGQQGAFGVVKVLLGSIRGQ